MREQTGLPILTARNNVVPVDEKALRGRRAIRATQYVFPSGGAKTPPMVQAPSVLETLTKIAGLTNPDDDAVHMHALRQTFDDVGMG